MNYVLQVVRGRSAATTLRLADGVTSLGRAGDCWIRIKSSQVSRKHCELFEVGDNLTVRDLASSNGTWVNGKRINGQQVLTAGDELTIGGVSFRVAALGGAVPDAPRPKAGETAVVEAVPVDEEEEFEIEFEAEEATAAEADLIPLADESPAPAAVKPAPPPQKPAAKASPEKKAAETPKGEHEDEAIAQFLLDLKLEDED